jgi:HlyD family secretion protein
LDQAQLQLKRTIIRAPIAGSVIAVSIKAGETAVPSAIGIPGSSLVAIADRDSIVADLNVDESDVSHLLIGQPAAIYCPPMPATALNGNILAIALALRTQRLGGPDTGGRNYSVKVAFRPDRLTAALRPGMECRATIYTSADQPKVAVPVQAVRTTRTDDVDGYAGSPRQNSRTTDYVFVDEDGVARKRFVTLGVADNLYQQVINGVKENANVIVGPYRTLVTLADGQRVQPLTSNKN